MMGPTFHFIVYLDRKYMVWWKKSSLYLNYWESYDNVIDFMAVISIVLF